MTLRSVRPGKEGQDGARSASVVAEVEVIGSWIVEVNCLLDESETEHLRVEIQVALRVRSNGRDVVKAGNRFHDIPFCRTLAAINEVRRDRKATLRLCL